MPLNKENKSKEENATNQHESKVNFIADTKTQLLQL